MKTLRSCSGDCAERCSGEERQCQQHNLFLFQDQAQPPRCHQVSQGERCYEGETSGSLMPSDPVVSQLALLYTAGLKNAHRV